ncbi:MAG: O-antigen ligase family protein [Patescibacteria group bacterium]|jgi:hypothetical protein
MKRTELANFLTYLCLFLLPWQTVWIYNSLTLNSSTGLGTFGGEGWEYGKMTHYAVQALIVVAVLLRWEAKKNETTKKIMATLWLFFAATVFVSFLSINFYLSGAFLFHLFSALLLFWLLLDERIETRKIIWFFSLGLIVPSLIGWWQVFVGVSPASTLFGLAEHLAATPGTSVVEVIGERLMRAYGTFAHPNIFGGYLAVVVMMILLRFSKRPALVAILVLLSSTLVVTFSRSAWLALIVGIIFFFVSSVISRKKIPQKFLLGLIIVILAAAAPLALFSDAVFTRVAAADRLEEQSLTERQSEYHMIGEVIKTNPFVGVGPGAYTLALEKLYPGQPVWSYQPMHNSYLLFFAETGLLGLVFLIYFLWVLFSGQSLQSLPSLSPLVSLAVLGVFDHYLWSQWAGLALVAVVLVVISKPTNQQINS